MGNGTAAHAPSARFAGTSPSMTMGRKTQIIAIPPLMCRVWPVM